MMALRNDSDVTRGAETLPERIPASEVIVIGGDIVVGRALEILLRSTERSVRFLAELSPSNLEVLKGARLLLLAPDSNAERHESLVELICSVPDAAQIPILNLVDTSAEVREGVGFVSWPCRMEYLNERIEEILSSRDGEIESCKEDIAILEGTKEMSDGTSVDRGK